MAKDTKHFFNPISVKGLIANGEIGSAGETLHSNGTATYWAIDDNSGGTVTSIATANGLSGGPITATGTIGIVSGSTLTVNTTGIHVNTANLSVATSQLTGDIALGTNTSGNYVATITAGNGISGSSSSEGGTPTIAVIAGNGIASNSIGVHVVAGNGTIVSNTLGVYVNAAALSIATSQLTGDVALGTNTSGNYVATITNANGISGSSSSEGGTPTIGVVTGSTLTVNTTGIHVNSALSITDLALTGNLTVSGTRTYINTTTLEVGDNIVTLNADLGANPPTENAGIEIMRGTSANVQFIWDETNDRWSTNSQPLAISSLVAAGAASGITTLAAGNTTITGFVNATASVNSAILSVGTSFIANTTGTYHTGTVNAASHTVGTSFVANTSATTITDTTAAANSTQVLAVKNGSYVLGIAPNAPAGAYNSLTTAGDSLIVATGTSIGNANLAIIPWSGASGGIRMATVANSTTIGITGNTTITGFANVSSTLAVAGITTFSGNVVFGSVGLSANGGFGTAGQVLHSNGTAAYWAADNDTTYTFSTGLVDTSGTITVNSAYIATISANNASFLGGTAAASYQLNSTLSANVATLSAAAVVKTVTGTTSAELVRGNMGDNDQARILIGATGTNAGYLEIATADDGTEPIYVRQYTGVFSTLTRTATLLDGSGNTTFPGSLSAGNISTAATANHIVQRDGSGDDFRRYGFAQYFNMSHAASGATTDTVFYSSGDDYIRKNNATGFRASLNVPTRTGGDASGTWGISVTGTAASTPNPTFSADAVTKNDLTTRTETGFYESSTGTLAEGWPTDSGGWHHLISSTHSNDSNYYALQIASRFDTQNLYFRNTNGSGTTAWNTILHGSVDFNNLTNKASGSGTYTTSGDFRAPIFYDSDNTAYYFDGNGNSVLNTAVMFGSLSMSGGLIVGRTSPNTDVNTANDGGSFSARGNTSTVAAMSFHRTDAYAINMGLGTDNVFRIGGWSASNNCLQVTGGGTVTALADFRAPIFYDVNDTTVRWDAGTFVLRSGSPTIYFRDTDANSAMIHVNDNLFYVLRGGNDTETWAQVNSQWPMVINLTNNDATFGGIVTAITDMRAPIFYDSQDTAYYTDPAGNNRMRNLNIGGSAGFDATFHMVGSQGGYDRLTQMGPNAANKPGLNILASRSAGNADQWWAWGPTAADVWCINSGTGLGTGGIQIDTSGNLTAAANVTAYSDLRLKKNIVQITDAIAKVKAIRGVMFERIDNGSRGTGVIAQEIEKVLPEVVLENQDGIKSVAYGNMVGLLIEAIKEQQAHINRLEQKINSLGV